jgi:lipopolysaccharide export system protein LptA
MMIGSACRAASLAACLAALHAPGLRAAEPLAPGAISIDATRSIEWQREKRILVARGDAKAKRGDTEVRAQTLTAHYRERPDGSAEVFRIEADGNVRITSPRQSAWGEHGTFDLDKDVLTLSGGKEVGAVTAANRITAQKELEYDTRTRTLVARGNAVAVDGDRTLYGDVITVLLRERPQGDSGLQRIEAERRVRFVTPEEDVRADRGTYDVDSGIARVDGSVRVIKGDNELNGCRGEVNLKTGVSKLMACADGRGSGRVQGVILPESMKKQ